MDAAPLVLGRGRGVAGLLLLLPNPALLPWPGCIFCTCFQILKFANFGASFVLLFKLTPSLFPRSPVPWLLLNPADGRLPL